MSTHTYFDRICVAVLILALLVTVLFMNGRSLGIQVMVDEDAETNSDSVYFTARDQDGSYSADSATAVITLNGESASVSGKGAYAYDGGVVITGGGTYVLSGTLTDGTVTVDAYSSSKVQIVLNGVDITCSDDACIRVNEADKVFLTLAEGTENTLTSGEAYSEAALADGADGAIFAHDDLTINGSGSLTVTAGYKHGIAANDDLVITGGTITVTAPQDAIHVNDSLRIMAASLTLDAGDDGIAVSKEGGYLYVESGSITITSADDAIHTAGDITIDGGTLTIDAGDDGIHSDTAVTIDGGTILIDRCYEGIEAPNITINGGDTTIYPTDDGLNANGGSSGFGSLGGFGGNMGGFGGGRGGMDRGSADTGASDRAGTVSADSVGAETVSAETVSAETVRADTDSADAAGENTERQRPEGEERSQGRTEDSASAPESAGATADDSDDALPCITITGGTLTILNATGQDADGLDSNGDIRISGGTIYVSLIGSGSNSAIDYGSESGGTAEITGGTLIACGASAMAESFDAASTQPSILYSLSSGAAAGTTVALEDTDGNVLFSWTVPNAFTSMNLSTPDMVLGGTYLVVIGDDVEEITLEEVTASYGDAQSSMFGGTMNWGGMQSRQDFTGGGMGGFGGRGGRGRWGSSESSTSVSGDADSAETPAASNGDVPDMGEMPSPPDGAFSDMGEMPSPPDGAFPDMGDRASRSDSESSESFPGRGDASQASESAAEDPAGEPSSSVTLTTQDWALLGASLLVLAAGLLFAIRYKRH
ncbi:MAG: carbohydrate-binding domain-containing protein [Oscillibacter sp.]|nr:carbohydrate-binding domain-containing protein [Oscillibacter sp.]